MNNLPNIPVPLYEIRKADVISVFDPEQFDSNPENYAETMLREIGLFDEAFYLEQYPDVLQAAMDPIYHYVHHGAWEKRNPTPWFYTEFYLEANPEVKKQSINPFFHYLCFGHLQGCKANPHEK